MKPEDEHVQDWMLHLGILFYHVNNCGLHIDHVYSSVAQVSYSLLTELINALENAPPITQAVRAQEVVLWLAARM